MEYEQRKSYYMNVGCEFWAHLSMDPIQTWPAEEVETDSDAAGPVFDPTILYSTFSFYELPSGTKSINLPKGFFSSLDWLSNDYLVS
jgi:hypothetical protein